MKIDKYSAILGNTVGYHDMSTLTSHRPVASLPFDGKYRLIDFPLSSLANAGIRSVFGIFQQENISSVFDHIRSGREWGLSTLLSHYYLGIYNTPVENTTVGPEYYQQLLTYLKRSGSNQTVALNCDVLMNIDLNQVFHLHNSVDRPITVKKLKKKPRKNTHKNCAISCVIWQWNTMLLPLNIQATLPIFIQWNPTTMQTWICWKTKNS